MNKIDPRIKVVADIIYKRDPIKYRKLIIWIREAEKYQFKTNVIEAALKEFEPKSGEIEKWYPYLDKIVSKIKHDFDMRASAVEHEIQKRESKEVAQVFGKGVVKDV